MRSGFAAQCKSCAFYILTEDLTGVLQFLKEIGILNIRAWHPSAEFASPDESPTYGFAQKYS
jgi:hypothetical protein